MIEEKRAVRKNSSAPFYYRRMNELSSPKRKRLLQQLLREESCQLVVIAGADEFTTATNRALQLARQCFYGKRLCESRIALCDSWLTTLRLLLHYKIIIVPLTIWKGDEREFANYLMWVSARRVLYQLEQKSTFDDDIESTAQCVSYATAYELGLNEDARVAAHERMMKFLSPIVESVYKRKARNRRFYRFFKRLPFALARWNLSVLKGKVTTATVHSVKIVGSPLFVANTSRALEALAKTSSGFIDNITSVIREIQEVSNLPDTKACVGPLFARSGSGNDVLKVVWCELRKVHHLLQYASLLAWYSNNPHTEGVGRNERLLVDAQVHAIEQDRFMHRVCKEAGAPPALLERIEYQFQQCYQQGL